jgi:hypothetical protein
VAAVPLGQKMVLLHFASSVQVQIFSNAMVFYPQKKI